LVLVEEPQYRASRLPGNVILVEEPGFSPAFLIFL